MIILSRVCSIIIGPQHLAIGLILMIRSSPFETERGELKGLHPGTAIASAM